MKPITEEQRGKILTLATTSKEVCVMQTIAKVMQGLNSAQRERVFIMMQDALTESKGGN